MPEKLGRNEEYLLFKKLRKIHFKTIPKTMKHPQTKSSKIYLVLVRKSCSTCSRISDMRAKWEMVCLRYSTSLLLSSLDVTLSLVMNFSRTWEGEGCTDGEDDRTKDGTSYNREEIRVPKYFQYEISIHISKK